MAQSSFSEHPQDWQPSPNQPAGPSVSDLTDRQPRQFGWVNWLGLWSLYSKEVTRFLKVWMQSLMAPLVTTFLFLVIFSLAFGDRQIGDGSIAFTQFLAPGLIMMAIIQNSFANSSSSIIGSKIQGNIVDVLMPPLSPLEQSLAYAGGAMTRGILVAVCVGVAMATFTGLGFHALWPILFFGFGAALILSFMGVITAIWAEKFDHTSAVTNFIVTPLAFLSGTFYSVDRLPGIWNSLSHFNPFFYLIDGFRYGFIGRADSNIWIGVVVVLGLNLALGTVTYMLFRSGWRLKS